MFTRFGRLASRKITPKNAAKANEVAEVPVQEQPVKSLFKPIAKVDISRFSNCKYVYSDICSYLTTFALCFGIGSKNESIANRGATHFMSHYLFGINSKMDVISSIRPLIGGGVNLNILNDRDNFIIIGHCGPDHVDHVFRRITDSLHHRLYRYDEFKYAIESCLIDYDNMLENSPESVLLDGLHHFAFRTGVGNKLYNEPLHVKKLDYDQVNCLFSSFTYVPFAISIAGNTTAIPSILNRYYETSVDSSIIENPMSLLHPCESESFRSGELRILIDRRTTYVAFCFNGTPKYGPDYWNFLILQKYLVNSSPKYHCTFGSSIINYALRKNFPAEDFCRVNGFNFSYANQGLFGIIVSSFNDKINEVSRVVFDCIKKAGTSTLDETKFEYARKAAKLEFLNYFENKDAYLVDMAKQALTTDSYVSPEVLAERFDDVKLSVFEKFMHKVLNDKPLMGVIGDPDYVDAIDKF